MPFFLVGVTISLLSFVFAELSLSRIQEAVSPPSTASAPMAVFLMED